MLKKTFNRLIKNDFKKCLKYYVYRERLEKLGLTALPERGRRDH